MTQIINALTARPRKSDRLSRAIALSGWHMARHDALRAAGL